MKNGKILLLIAVLCAVVMLMSCAENSEEEIVPEYEADIEEGFDFNGRDFTIIAYAREGRLELDPMSEYENTFWTEKLGDRYKEIEADCNVSFKLKGDDNMMVANYISGLPWGELYDAFASTLLNYCNSGYLTALEDIDGFTEGIERGKWGSENSLAAFKRRESYFAFRSGFWGIPFPQFNGVIYANIPVMSIYGINALEMIENGEWTWDNFEKACLDIGGSFENEDEPVGYVFDSMWGDYFLRAAIMSNGVDFAKLGSDGKYTFNLDCREAVEALEWSLSFQQNLGTGLIEGGEWLDSMYPRFIDGKVGFICQYTYAGTVDTTGFCYSDADYYILPFPMGPSGKYGNWGSFISFADRYFAVPVTADLYMVNGILARLFEPFTGEAEFSWKESYESTMFLHSESAKYYYEMYDCAHFDFYDMAGAFPWVDILKGSTSITEAISSVKDKCQSILDENYN